MGEHRAAEWRAQKAPEFSVAAGPRASSASTPRITMLTVTAG